MRYTESRLTQIAGDLIDEIRKQTVRVRPNYDGTTFEPVVLPAQVPNLLINGATGIAVGMATNIPPHHLRELVDALIALIKKPDLSLEQLWSSTSRVQTSPPAGCSSRTVSHPRRPTRRAGGVTIRADWSVENDEPDKSRS